MWIVEELLDKLDGSVEVDTQKGTRFTVEFPVA